MVNMNVSNSEGVCNNRELIDNSDNSRHSARLTALLHDIMMERERQTTRVFVPEAQDVELIFTPSWPVIFQTAFLNSGPFDSVNGPRDDLLFFVFKKPSLRSKVTLKVFRHNSCKLPDFNDPAIDWEETVYLNLLMQYLVYTVTVAVCTRTGPQELQILKKFSETVYASPNRHRMDSKGKSDEVVYPNLFFSVDNYDEVFSGCVIRDSECLCVELTAYDLSGKIRGVCFLGTIQYESLNKFYNSKSSTPIQRPEGFGLLSHQFGSMSGRGALCSLGTSAQRPSTVVKFMRMLGPRAQGLAEFAVCAVESDNSDDRIVFCRCGNRLGLFDAVCCVCGATESPAHRMFHDLTDHIQPNQPESSSKVESELGSPVTQQPTQFSTLPSAFFDDWSNFNDCGIPELSSKTGTTASIQHIATLRSIPSSAKSAGASAETSPVRRWASSSRLQNRLVEPPGVSMVDGPRLLHLGHRPRHGSKVSEILDRFTRVGTTCERNGTTQPTLEQSSMPNVVRKCADVIVNPSEVSLNQQTVQQNSINNRTLSINKENHSDSNDGCLFRSRESHRRSFGQAWSWFKERRRFASVGLNASLTFLSIPSSSILMDILESKREPILKIAD